MTTWITICETCRRDGHDPVRQPETDGARLAGLVAAAAAGSGLAVRRTACLMGCAQACTVAVQAAGKLSYTIGRLAPDREAAEGIVAWARLHAGSATGQVPYRLWPAAVKGHFLSRHPPLPGERPSDAGP